MAFTQFKRTMREAAQKLDLHPGDLYEDCSYHPVLCLGVNYKTDELWGVSLIDGSYPRCCSLVHCGVRKLSPKQAWLLKARGPSRARVRERIAPDEQWWSAASATGSRIVRRVEPAKVSDRQRKVRA
jgi:hypothetical protein